MRALPRLTPPLNHLCCCSNNLGVLQRLASPERGVDASVAPSAGAFSGGAQVDLGAAVPSALLLVLLLGLSLQRILGLDRVLLRWAREWRDARQYAQRQDVIAARAALERRFSEDAADERGGEGGPS